MNRYNSNAQEVKITNQPGRIGFMGLLTLVFIVLKLTGYIAWSWWWVLSPLWIPALVILFIFLATFIFLVIFGK